MNKRSFCDLYSLRTLIFSFCFALIILNFGSVCKSDVFCTVPVYRAHFTDLFNFSVATIVAWWRHVAYCERLPLFVRDPLPIVIIYICWLLLKHSRCLCDVCLSCSLFLSRTWAPTAIEYILSIFLILCCVSSLFSDLSLSLLLPSL